MIDFKITKKKKIFEICNDMCHNYYYLIYGKIYNEEKTKYRKFKYIEYFDIFDLQEYFEKDYITKEDIKIYVDNIENVLLLNIKNYEDTENIKNFYDYCNYTIKKFNNIIKNY